jgi:oligopeptide/dipeptide ABC transporter ATP-binding protein
MIDVATEPLLDVHDLVVRYPVRRTLSAAIRREPHRFVHAVNGISFSIRRGEMLALVGESGCGKTTTAQTIMRMVAEESGSIALAGREISGVSQHGLRPVRRRMQMIYQDPYESLDPRFRVRQTLEEPMLIHRLGGDREQRRRRVFDVLRRVDLSPPELYLDRYPHELSGGQRQRVAIAASLVIEPDLLIADEPASMLDVSVRAGVLRLLDRLRRDASLGVLMITHDLSTAATFADRIAVMYLGRIVEEGPARSVIHDPQHPYTKALLSVVPKRDPRDRTRPQVLTGETPNPVALPSGCSFHPRCPVAQERCRTIDPELRPAGTEDHVAACVLVGEPAGSAGSASDARWQRPRTVEENPSTA